MCFHVCELAHRRTSYTHLRLTLLLISCLVAVFWLFDIDLLRPALEEDVESPLSLFGRSEEVILSSEPILDDQHNNVTIGKVSMLLGPTNSLYERALNLQAAHSDKFGYLMFVLREQTLPNSHWSKPAHLLQVLLSELARPVDQRLDWLFWVDADIVLMNPNIPLEIFLPPATPPFAHINLVATSDHRGLNTGAFFLRVCPWSVQLLHAILALPIYLPDTPLKFADQSAMDQMLSSSQGPLGDRFTNGSVVVPQRWFNAHAGSRGRGDHDPFSRPKRFSPNAVLEGDLQVHLASGGKKRRKQFMNSFLAASELHTERWEIPLDRTAYVKEREIERFWNKEAAKRTRGKWKSKTNSKIERKRRKK